MDDTKTLNEICYILGVSRRTVQGYEEMGLVWASGKNKYGYLLYDSKTQGRIKRIKLFQQAGFKLKEIKEIIDAPNDILKESLKLKIQNLRDEIEQKESVIRKMEELFESL